MVPRLCRKWATANPKEKIRKSKWMKRKCNSLSFEFEPRWCNVHHTSTHISLQLNVNMEPHIRSFALNSVNSTNCRNNKNGKQNRKHIKNRKLFSIYPPTTTLSRLSSLSLNIISCCRRRRRLRHHLRRSFFIIFFILDAKWKPSFRHHSIHNNNNISVFRFFFFISSLLQSSLIYSHKIFRVCTVQRARLLRNDEVFSSLHRRAFVIRSTKKMKENELKSRKFANFFFLSLATKTLMK